MMQQYIEFASNHTILIASFVIVLGMIIGSEFNLLTRGFKNISPGDVTRLMNHEDTLLLDIRTIGEHREGHIINCIHIPTNELDKRISELNKHKNAHIITYCRTGNRSIAACKTLKRQGFEHVHNLGGGILAWESANLPTTKN